MSPISTTRSSPVLAPAVSTTLFGLGFSWGRVSAVGPLTAAAFCQQPERSPVYPNPSSSSSSNRSVYGPLAVMGKPLPAKKYIWCKHRTSRKPNAALYSGSRTAELLFHFNSNEQTLTWLVELEAEWGIGSWTLALAATATSPFCLQVDGFCASAPSLLILRLICIHAAVQRP